MGGTPPGRPQQQPQADCKLLLVMRTFRAVVQNKCLDTHMTCEDRSGEHRSSRNILGSHQPKTKPAQASIELVLVDDQSGHCPKTFKVNVEKPLRPGPETDI